MRDEVKILIYGRSAECIHTQELLRVLSHQSETVYRYAAVDDFEELRMKLVDFEPELVIVVEDGAAGMEAVYRVRRYSSLIPVFWFSDDVDFGMQSHRLECSYFAVKPVMQDKMQRAFQRCSPGVWS